MGNDEAVTPSKSDKASSPVQVKRQSLIFFPSHFFNIRNLFVFLTALLYNAAVLCLHVVFMDEICLRSVCNFVVKFTRRAK